MKKTTSTTQIKHDPKFNQTWPQSEVEATQSQNNDDAEAHNTNLEPQVELQNDENARKLNDNRNNCGSRAACR